jgi:hypothetical protein
MSNIGTTIGLGKMGMKPTAGQVVKAQAAAKKKIGDLSYKPSDAQKKAILAAALKNVMKGEEKKEEPKPTLTQGDVDESNIESGVKMMLADAIVALKDLPKFPDGSFRSPSLAIDELVVEPLKRKNYFDAAEDVTKLRRDIPDNDVSKKLTKTFLNKAYKPVIDYLKKLYSTPDPLEVKTKAPNAPKAPAAAAPKAAAPKAAPAPPKKATPVEILYKLGSVIEKLDPDSHIVVKRYGDSEREYKIKYDELSSPLKEELKSLAGSDIEQVYLIGESGCKLRMRIDTSGFYIYVETQDNWAREYVYRDMFETVGSVLKDSEYMTKKYRAK